MFKDTLEANILAILSIIRVKSFLSNCFYIIIIFIHILVLFNYFFLVSKKINSIICKKSTFPRNLSMKVNWTFEFSGF